MPMPSTRTLAALAYERGEDYDPALALPTPALIEQRSLGERATPLIEAPSSYQRRRQRDRRRRQALASVPDWLSVDDLLADPLARLHGEPV
jgi:hypothetical protein